LRAANRTQVSRDGLPIDWLCPSHPDNFALETNSMMEVVRNYDVDGIHFDYIRYPDSDYCYCPGCRDRFQSQTGQTVTNWPADVLAAGTLRNGYLDWRRAQITRLVAAVHSGVKALKPADIDSRIIMLTVSDSAEDLIAALRAGADGYLLKDMEPEDLLINIRSAGLGRMTLNDKLTGMLARALSEGIRPKNPAEAGLTEQEGKILEQISTGKSNKIIAHELGITEGTVKVHVKHLLKKLNLKSRVEAALWAIGKSNKTQ